ncbi:ABC transporter ATP-binding protein [Marinitenerispora sediminis]|uniref:Multidrug ABC transporter ATP-binding protein n=1 Tax=Marinitenerispora sediminis TaxID=1931232 RepID=A0A368T362_9ACTN|nr:ABC transporter ATP-binding protein [Marinitenerispora sediminis]RCV51932.1 multidrug ABC transporter ATP-binding protein [Marinitenerispora sediminis]RCV53164.1 multidrug ABC transporter ATP-binding protein [Marinitenerispora sediminis]RCV56093.1 multidrug ABC transporter ATP-binding protein [Marinitenerispora sediminis]
MTVETPTRGLPVADGREVRAFARATLARHRRPALGVLVLHGAASTAGLAAPWLLGTVVDDVVGGTGSTGRIDLATAGIAGCLLLHALLSYLSVTASIRLGERVLAELREDFIDRVLRLRLATVERAGTGDLVARTGRDIDHLSSTVREGLPEIAISLVTFLLTAVGIALVNPLLVLPALTALPLLWAGTRWYLRRAPQGYVADLASYSTMLQGLSDTVEGAHTVEALRRERQRDQRTDADIARSYATERYLLWLRTVWFPTVEISHILPIAATLLTGGWLLMNGHASLGEVTAATLYVQQLVGPVQQLFEQVDPTMQSYAALRRLLGVRLAEETAGSGPRAGEPAAAAPAAAPADPARAGGRTSADGSVVLRGVSFGYRPEEDVVRDVDLELRSGERLAIVGPSGAGKSTLGRLIAGVHPPRTGSILVGGRPLTGLSPEEQRSRVALVTQEAHVFKGTVGDNVAMVREGAATPEAILAALTAVGADGWVRELPDGLDTEVGSGGRTLDPARSQQLALARLVLADPRVLILDEATSLLDPRAARDLERSLSAVLADRTVIAIAHRLQTACDADRIAVVEDGRVTELGTHDDLLAEGGTYAALWRTWHGE